jgi:hypothetical protein
VIVDIEAFEYRTLSAGTSRARSTARNFANVAEILPKYRDLSVADLITSTVKDPLAALDRAVQTKDGQQFAAAYAQLTAARNVCHQRYDRRVIAIQRPTAPFPDQDFRPPTK